MDFHPQSTDFSFRWVFQEDIPTLVPKWLRDRIHFFMKDADPQQHNEIQSAMSTHFVNATEIWDGGECTALCKYIHLYTTRVMVVGRSSDSHMVVLLDEPRFC